MTSRLIMAALVIFSALPADARLGESVDRCMARYGQLIQRDEPRDRGTFLKLTFASGNYRIEILFESDDTAGRLEFYHPGIDSQNLNEPLTSDEIQSLLDKNSNGKVWKLAKDSTDENSQWTLADGSATAYYEKRHLVFLSKAMAAEIAAGNRAAAEEGQKDF